MDRTIREEIRTTPIQSRNIPSNNRRGKQRYSRIHQVQFNTNMHYDIISYQIISRSHSCGFDASEHEYESMSRHGRKVPTSFYHRFALVARRFADKYSQGRLISVLEGGYSDRALTSGAMAHVVGLSQDYDESVDTTWWSLPNLIHVGVMTRSNCLDCSSFMIVARASDKETQRRKTISDNEQLKLSTTSLVTTGLRNLLNH